MCSSTFDITTTSNRPGGSVQLEIDGSVALWADWDRYRPKTAQVRESVDTILFGLQVTFR